MKRILILTVLVALLAAACGDDSAASTTATTTTTTAATTTMAPVTTTTDAATTTAVVTTTTAAVTTTTTTIVYAVDSSSFFPDVLGSAGDPNGSGCVVNADILPNGVWFGYATSVSGATITFDLACFFTGDAAVAAATADAAEAFDFYIRNQNPKTYSVPIDGGADVFIVDPVTIEETQISAASWPSGASFVPCPGEFCAVWLYVNGGQATGLVEQYLP